jgi:hypothetical protein
MGFVVWAIDAPCLSPYHTDVIYYSPEVFDGSRPGTSN